MDLLKSNNARRAWYPAGPHSSDLESKKSDHVSRESFESTALVCNSQIDWCELSWIASSPHSSIALAVPPPKFPSDPESSSVVFFYQKCSLRHRKCFVRGYIHELFVSKPERARYERVRAFDTNNSWIWPCTKHFLRRELFITHIRRVFTEIVFLV